MFKQRRPERRMLVLLSGYVNLMFPVFLGLVFTFCSNTNSLQENTYTMQITEDRIVIPIDSNTIQRTYYFHQFEWKGEHFLGWQNRVTNSIQLFNLSTRRQLPDIAFAKEGPNSVKVGGFFFVTPDSILVRGSYDNYMHVSNRSGTLIGERTPVLPDTFSVPQYVHEEPGCPIVLREDKACFCALSPLNTYLDYEEKFTTSPLGRWVNLSTRETGYVSYNKYPPVYQKIVLPSEFWSYSRCLDPFGNFVYSFPIDPFIYVIPEFAGGAENTVRKSRLAGDLMPENWPRNKARSDMDDHRYRIETPAYFNIIYDKYRRVFYRFFRLGGTYDEDTDMMSKIIEYQSKPAGVIIADQNLNKIGEVILPENRFYIQNWLILPDGLYLSDAHHRNEDLPEDVISFTKLTLLETDE